MHFITGFKLQCFMIIFMTLFHAFHQIELYEAAAARNRHQFQEILRISKQYSRKLALYVDPTTVILVLNIQFIRIIRYF